MKICSEVQRVVCSPRANMHTYAFRWITVMRQLNVILFHIYFPFTVTENEVAMVQKKKNKTATVLDVTSAAETNHTLYYHKCSLKTSGFVKMTLSQASSTFEIQPQSFHLCIFPFKYENCKYFSDRDIFHIPPLPTFAFSVYRIQSYCWWCSNFTHVYSFVQSLVMVSHTVGLCGFRVCMLVMNIKAFRKLNTFQHINQTFRSKFRQRRDWGMLLLHEWEN